MASRLLAFLTFLVVLLVGFFSGYLLAQSPWAPLNLFVPTLPTSEGSQKTLEPFFQTWNLVQTRYYEQPVNNDALTEGAIDGMLTALGDRNTSYLPPEEEAIGRESLAGEFTGIGVEIENIDGAVIIISPIDDTPAARAGLQPGDIIRKSDGIDLDGLAPTEVVRLVRGPAGTAVILTIERQKALFDVEIVRDIIQLKTVRGELLEGEVAYLRLNRFAQNTSEEVETTLTKLLGQNPVGLILDLRHNPGGLLETAVDVAEQFLPEGIILIEEFGNGQEIIHRTSAKGLAQTIPLVVLIDEGSASASEVLAGAIQDLDRGILIGQISFGKGTVQSWQTLSNGGGLRLTIARWLTPNEAWVQEKGLAPDYVITLPDRDEAGKLDDTQLQAAINYLLGEEIYWNP